MKQKTLIIVFFLLLKFNSYSQLTLEHTYYDIYSYNSDTYLKCSFNTQNSNFYYTYTRGANPTVTLYNSNHEFYKTIQLPSEAYYSFSSVSLFCDKLFDSDDLIEFVYISRNSYNADNFKMKVMNENGDVVVDLLNNRYASIIKTPQDEYKLITQCLIGGRTTSVYSLTGTLSTGQENLIDNKMVSYPNPANSTININIPEGMAKNSELKIFAIDGRQVLKTPLRDDGSKTISIDVSTLSSGTYIYKIDKFSDKFIKE